MMNIQHDTRPVELLRPSEPEPVRKPEREIEHGPPARGAEPRRTSLAGAWRLACFVRCGGLWRLASLSTSYRSHSDGGTNARLRPGSSDRPCAREPGDGVGLLARLDPGLQLADIFARASGYIFTRNVDIGEPRQEGRLVLVEITVPEIHDQIAQDEATLAISSEPRWSRRRPT